MNYLRKFPKKWAVGDAFCNRESERKKLKSALGSAQHVLIKSPRRFGKTSLSMYVLDKIDIPSQRINLFVAMDESSAIKIIVSGVKELISRIAKPTEKFMLMMSQFFNESRLNWTVGFSGLSLNVIENVKETTPELISDVLKILDKTCEYQGRQAILFLDEFQELGKLSLSKGIEGAIRGVAESTQYISFLFSGSNRHLLERIFNDDTRPLYNLCDQITLSRISQKDYEKFISEYALKTWGQDFCGYAYEELFLSTMRHPYYMNAFCRLIWASCDKPPSADAMIELWKELLDQESDQAAILFNELNNSQKKVLMAIANGINQKLMSKDALAKLSLSARAVSNALNDLVKMDYVLQNAEGEYEIINPILNAILLEYYGNYF